MNDFKKIPGPTATSDLFVRQMRCSVTGNRERF